ncbi:NCS2 family permease [Dielma fastidiosa]|uniref:NCS2 family permease n=1 Tax=Dielma fastidiosa TaxID=1034346 RepID=UPI000E4C908E|nr:NCS2 family permease [Dielma fastidiosa]RHM98995.1 NCS2 family permease [Dielma fastidiosa]
MLEKLFKLKEKHTSVKTEIIAGVTTFLTMAYILGVNPNMLSATGMDFNSVFLATAISSGIASILMGLLANYPVSLAPGMGVNALFTYTVCFQYGYTWQEALAVVLLSGVIFFIISVTGLRKMVVNAIPKHLKAAIGAGIGFFIAFIGLKNAGIVVANASTYVGLGPFTDPTVALCLFGIVVTVVLLIRKVNAAVFYGLIITAVVGVVLGMLGVSGMPAMPSGVVDSIPAMPTFMAFTEGFSTLFSHTDLILVLFSFLFVDFFDTAGTLVAIASRIDLIDEKGELINAEQAFVADSVGTCVGAVLGTSTVTSFVESTSGVAAGGRTGLTAVVTGVLFLLAVFFTPLLSVFNSVPVMIGETQYFLSPVTSPALIIVGVLMVQQLREIDWTDLALAAPCFITVIMMVCASSISDGIALGFITYGIAQIATGKVKEVHISMWVLILIFIARFIFI